MSTNSIDDTPPLSRLSALILSPSYLSLVVDGSGRKEGSKVSRHIYQCSDDVFPHVYSHWQVPLISSPSAETIPDRRENASHGCQGSSVIYNRDPVQSDVQDAPFEPRQGQYDPDSPWPDASQDLEFPLNDPQNPALYLTKDPLTTESAILSLAPGVCSPPLSESSGAAFIPEGRQISGSDASKSPIVIPVPSCRSREDLQDRGAWTPTVSQVETIGYRANELETVFYYGPQESSLQVSYGPHYILPVPVPEPYYFGAMKPNLSSSQSPSVYASNNYAVSPPTQAVPHFQSRASNTKEKPDKKYFCPSDDRIVLIVLTSPTPSDDVIGALWICVGKEGRH
ncbi:hypothetical protein EI94DRAFT_1807244 [Lactarius quietus]|nr:hypothetical protein EI94DRAFT_1807244 [Lactarius quietus]